ncbi:MAG TPA: FixH family protein [Myxococcota bacterium]
MFRSAAQGSLVVLALAFVGAFTSACPAPADATDAGPQGTPDAGPFPDAPLTTVDTASGLHIEVRAIPQPVTVNVDPFELTITNSDGSPATGLTFKVVPYMPQMGHGPTSKPVVTEEGGGIYGLANVDIFMAGQWELRTTFDQNSDFAAPSFNVTQ